MLVRIFRTLVQISSLTISFESYIMEYPLEGYYEKF